MLLAATFLQHRKVIAGTLMARVGGVPVLYALVTIRKTVVQTSPCDNHPNRDGRHSGADHARLRRRSSEPMPGHVLHALSRDHQSSIGAQRLCRWQPRQRSPNMESDMVNSLEHRGPFLAATLISVLLGCTASLA
jgi:hypothetical protein